MMNKSENFINYNVNEVQFQITPTINEISIFELVSYEYQYITKKINIYGLPVYIYECVDMPQPSDSIYVVFSSFILNKYSANSKGTSLLATTKSSNPSSVPLRDIGFLNKYKFNYIFFNFPDEIKENIFTRFEINFADRNGYDASNFNIFSFNNSSGESKISLDTLIKIPINRNNQGVNRSITFTINKKFTMENANLILIIYNLKEIDIASIRIYFKSPTTGLIEDTQEEVAPRETLRLISSNPNEQINIMGLDTLSTQIEEEEEETTQFYSSGGITNNINLLTKLRVPWAVYDASIVCQNSDSVIIDQVKGGGCRNATISGPSTLEKDTIYYIKGTQNTCIEFPEGSMPTTYTICAITKYNNPNANKLEVLKTVYSNPKIVIGHANNTRGIVTKNDNICTIDASSDFKSKNPTEWVVTCIKSNGTNVRKTIIINNEKRGNILLENLTFKEKLIINSNNNNKNNCSDFGFSYMIIWDQLLSDNELVMVSRSLNNYLNDTSKKINIDRTLLTIKDGSTMFKAADSARDIMENFCITKNGRYWINTGGSGEPEYVFCIMDKKCKGGGWMLAMKGSKNDNKTFNYNSIYWTTDRTLNAHPFDRPDDFEENKFYMETNIDAKFRIFNTFKAKECLAIFDPRDFGKGNDPAYYTSYYSLREYGWIWHENNFNNGNKISLLDFFKSGKSQFFYSTRNTSENNELTLINYMNSKYDPNLVKFLGFEYPFNYQEQYNRKILYSPEDRTYNNPDNRAPCNIYIWSTQSQFYSFGFNVGPIIEETDPDKIAAARASWPHRVRWGGSYNENLEKNSKPLSNDVSGGIGMEFNNYSAGDGFICCQNNTGQNRHFSFKWFIR